MKFVIFAVVAAVAFAAPDKPRYGAPPPPRYGSGSQESSEILRQEFDIQDDGTYAMAVETSNGIAASASGQPSGPEGSVVKSGVFSWISPEGEAIEVQWVADENGYQPDSAVLPVAPEFPHPIPDFVLAQIAKAAEEDRNRSRERPSGSYGAPPPRYN